MQSWNISELDDYDRRSCKGESPDIFYAPPFEEKENRDQRIKIARTICASCVIREECLNFALNTRQDDGIWGGLTFEERRSLQRTRRING